MRSLMVCCLVLLACSFLALAQESQTVNVQLGKYEDLTEAIRKERGQVVLVDFWTTTCQPCIKNFPDMVKLSNQYKKEGLVVISVSLDEIEEGQGSVVQDRVRKILTEKKTNFALNLLLDETDKVVKEKLRVQSMPCVYIFNRQGKWTSLNNEIKVEVKHEVIEKLVVEFLRMK